MHIKTSLVVSVLAVAAWVSPASAQAESQTEPEPKEFSCTFTSGTSWSFDNGAFQSSKAHPLKLVITSIDLEGQTAQLAAEPGKTPTQLKIVRAINANHFLEVVNEGFLNLTTIYDKDPASGSHPAVHSRHVGVLGQPVVGQYLGTCTEK